MFPKAPSKIPRKAFLRRLIGLGALPWWLLATQGPEEQRMVYAGPLRGADFYDFPALAPGLQAGARVRCFAEPNNPYDAHAVAVYHGKYKLGYLPREANVVPARLLRQHGAQLAGVIDPHPPEGPWLEIGGKRI
jgi:hypothetical protein